MKIIATVSTLLSLVVCLGAAVWYFLGSISYSTYTGVLAVFSVLYFISAIDWRTLA